MARLKRFDAVVPTIARILKRFWPQIRQQRGAIALSFLCLLVETAMRLLEPWPLKFIFDRIILTGFAANEAEIFALDNLNPMVLLTLLTLALVTIATLRGVFAYFSAVKMAIAATHIMTEIRFRLYSHLQHLSLSFHNQAKSGDLIARVTYDIERLREVTVVAILPLLTNLLTLVGMLGVMVWLNWELALIALAALPLFALTTALMSRKIQKVARKQRKREGAMAATAAEAINAIEVVQALSLQDFLEQTFASHNQKSLRDSATSQKLRAGQERMVEILVAIATALVLWRGVQLIFQGTVTPGDLLVFVTYLKVAFKPMRQLAKYTGQIAKATASGERILDLLDTVPEVRDLRGARPAPPFRGAIRFDRVGFAYDLNRGTLNNLNLEVRPGEVVALVSPSGGGKSTIASLLLRFYDPQVGSISIDGRDIREYTLASLRQQITIVLQESVLFATSIRNNIAYGALGASDDAIVAAAKLANAHDFITALPQGYDTVLGERGVTLSGGQRQRIAIARAAVRQAPIVILDEPTTGLDRHNERAIDEALARLARGRTTFLISHNLHAVEQVDRIFYLEGGTIVECGTHRELLQLGGRYASLYRSQTRELSARQDGDRGENRHVVTV